MDDFKILLERHGLRVTKPRTLVFDVLLRSHNPLSNVDIFKQIGTIDRASVYRTIESLIKIGAVKEVYIGWKKLYELTDTFSPHHHHLRCIKCGKLSHVSDASFEKSIESIASDRGYKLLAHHFEIDGICPDCQLAIA